MSSVIVQAEKKKPRRPWLPVLGLIFAIAVLAFSYGISTPLVKYAANHNTKMATSFHDLRTNFQKYKWYTDSEKYHKGKIVEIIAALVLWLVLMALSMFVVAATLIGTDPEKEVWDNLGPSPANKKATVKKMKKDLKQAKKLAREQKKKQDKK